MHIGILVTNTDESSFAQQHPKDGDKFRALLSPLRPNWEFSVFSVKDGIFPEDISAIDGLIVTGSPASVNDSAPWIERLMDLIIDAHAKTVPMYGACFGHQAIAKALGGVVDKNPDDWVFGTVDTQLSLPWDKNTFSVSLYAAHTEQVSTLPPTAKPTGDTPGCPFASFAIGNHIWTTQYHPEMTHEFMRELVEEYASELSTSVLDQARESLNTKADREVLALAIVRFFEHSKAQA